MKLREYIQKKLTWNHDQIHGCLRFDEPQSIIWEYREMLIIREGKLLGCEEFDKELSFGFFSSVFQFSSEKIPGLWVPDTQPNQAM